MFTLTQMSLMHQFNILLLNINMHKNSLEVQGGGLQYRRQCSVVLLCS